MQRARGPKPKLDPYKVPQDFDKSLLGEVDVSSKDAAEAVLRDAFWGRWMQLRAEVNTLLPSPCVKPVCFGEQGSSHLVMVLSFYAVLVRQAA